METRAMAEAQPAWRFTGVDPSAAMLDLARQTLKPFADRAQRLNWPLADTSMASTIFAGDTPPWITNRRYHSRP